MITIKNKETVCEFNIGTAPYEINLKIPLSFPTSQNVRSLAYRIIHLHNLPIFYHSGIVFKEHFTVIF